MFSKTFSKNKKNHYQKKIKCLIIYNKTQNVWCVMSLYNIYVVLFCF